MILRATLFPHFEGTASETLQQNDEFQMSCGMDTVRMNSHEPDIRPALRVETVNLPPVHTRLVIRRMGARNLLCFAVTGSIGARSVRFVVAF